MTEYYVYENWHRKRGAVHLADCSFCNQGRGMHERDSGRFGKWLGPYDRNEAFEKVEALQKEGIDVQPCLICKP
jgi:hypothetical protein